MVGCTTSGEMLDSQHFNGHTVISGIVSPLVKWTATVIEDIKTMSEKKATDATGRMVKALGLDPAMGCGLVVRA